MSVDELMEWAYACSASGDVEGATEVCRKADDLGDAEAVILLGNALRKRGDFDSARAAYERAEARGHREAARSLGNLFWDRGDTRTAKAAFLRSIELGSDIATLNLGLMLAGAGETDEALGHLRRAAEAGDPRGFWGIGMTLERAGDFAGAAEAYRKGADLNDSDCAFGLGMALYEVGDLPGSRTALTKAHELGDDRAAGLLEALDRGPSVSELWANVTGIYEALAAARKELGRQWIEGTLEIRVKEARIAALRAAHEDLRKQLASVVQRFHAQPYASRECHFDWPPPGPAPSNWLSLKSGSWHLIQSQSQAFEMDLQTGRSSLQQAEKKWLNAGLLRNGNAALCRVVNRLDALRSAISAAELELQGAFKARDQSARAAADVACIAFDRAAALAASSADDLPPILQPWSSPSWGSWTLEDGRSLGLRLAFGGTLRPKQDERLGSNASFGTDVSIPWGFALHDSWHITHDAPGRRPAHGFVRSMMLRQLLSVSPGEVRFCIFDPVGLGQSAGDLLDLAEYDADLIGGKVWSSAQDLEARLAELSAHIELVIQ